MEPPAIGWTSKTLAADSADARRRRPALFACDQLLVNLSGHVFNLHAGLARHAVGRGWHYRAILPRDVEDPRILEELSPLPALDAVFIKLFDNPTVEIGAANLQFYRDLTASLTPEVTQGDLCLFPAVMHRNMYGLMKWYDALAVKPRLVLLLWSQQCFDGRNVTRNRGFYRDLLTWAAARNRIAPGHDPAIVVFAFAAQHIPVLSDLCDGSVPIEPFPLNGFTWILPPGPEPAPVTPTGAGPPTLGYLGNSWWPDKGLEQMLEAIALLDRRGVSARYIVQIDLRFAQPEARARLGAHQSVLGADTVEVVEGTLSAADYARALTRCSGIVLPYGPAYDLQTSGILFEALALGIPVVTRAGSLPAQDIVRLGAEQPFFGPWTADDVADAMQALLSRLDHYTDQARSVSARARNTLSIDCFLDRIGCLPQVP